MSHLEQREDENEQDVAYLVEKREFVRSYHRSGYVRKLLGISNKDGTQQQAWVRLRVVLLILTSFSISVHLYIVIS